MADKVLSWPKFVSSAYGACQLRIQDSNLYEDREHHFSQFGAHDELFCKFNYETREIYGVNAQDHRQSACEQRSLAKFDTRMYMELWMMVQ